MEHWKYTAEINGVFYSTYSPIDKSLSEDDQSERVVVGWSQVKEGIIHYTASKDWIKKNKKHAKEWQERNGFTQTKSVI
jgi:hypothetical protein